MDKDIQQMKESIKALQDQVSTLQRIVGQNSTTSYKTGKREIINREVQFLQKVYDRSGNIVSEINT